MFHVKHYNIHLNTAEPKKQLNEPREASKREMPSQTPKNAQKEAINDIVSRETIDLSNPNVRKRPCCSKQHKRSRKNNWKYVKSEADTLFHVKQCDKSEVMREKHINRSKNDGMEQKVRQKNSICDIKKTHTKCQIE